MNKCLAEFASADAKHSESFFAGTCASRKILLAERTVGPKGLRGAEPNPHSN